MSEFVIVSLVTFIIIREISYQIQLNKLVNKIMSKNYYDYKFSESLPNNDEFKKEPVIQNEEVDLNLTTLNSLL